MSQEVLTLRPMGNGLWIEDANSSQSHQYMLKPLMEAGFREFLNQELSDHEQQLSEGIARVFEKQPERLFTAAQVARMVREVAKETKTGRSDSQ